MNRDVWLERRELLEYLLKEHVRRGGKVVGLQQGMSYEPKVLDQVNVTMLLKQLQGGAPLDLSRAMLPPHAAVSSPGPRPPLPSSSSRFPPPAGDNPFGPPAPAPSSGRSLPGDNPFGAPAPAAPLASASGSSAVGGSAGGGQRHSHHISADNPFGGPSGSSGGGGGGANPFGSAAGKRPSAGAAAGGTLTAADAAMFAKTRSSKASVGSTSGGGGMEPPVTAVATATKLSYSVSAAAAPSPQRHSGRDRDPGVGRVSDGSADGYGDGMDDGAGGIRPPRLDLPQLETGQTDDQLRDLAFLLFAACASGTGLPQHAALLPVVRQQLLIDEGRAADIARVLRHIQPGGEPTLIDAMHPSHHSSPPVTNGSGLTHGSSAGLWRPSQRASLELLLKLIAVVRPSDFLGGGGRGGSGGQGAGGEAAGAQARAFKGFLRWKDMTVAVLERQLAMAVESGWTGDKTQLKKMLARMHGAARRADVRGEGDFEDEEYGEATRQLAEVAGRLAEGCAAGLRFPWGVRVRLCEILIAAIFDSLDPGCYVDEAALVLQFLDSVMWPALGLAAPAALAVSGWVHFSMYVGTGCREQRLVKQLKQLIVRLAAAAAEAPAKGSDPFCLGPDAVAPPAAPPEELSRDTALAAQVADRIVEWVYDRLCDYHAAFPKGENMGPLLDVFVFAARSRGDPQERLAGLLAAAVRASTGAQFARLASSRVEAGAPIETRLLQLASVAHHIHDADESLFCGPLLGPHLPAALGVAAARLHELYGTHLAPWLGTVSGISPSVLDVFRTANALEQRLAAPIARAGGGATAGGAGGGGGGATGSSSSPPSKGSLGGGGSASAAAAGAAGGGETPVKATAGAAAADPAAGTGDGLSAAGAAAGAVVAVPKSSGLYPPVPGAAGAPVPGPQQPRAVSEALAAHRRWDLTGPLRGAMLQWVASQVASMNTWAARALQAEKWRPMGPGPDCAHSQSAVDVSRMAFEAMEALYGMDVPLPPEVPYALLEGIDAVLRKYVTHVNEKLGDLQRVLPPLPPLTRYKKEVVAKQEAVEMEAGRGTAKGKKPAFLASVPPIESSPEHTNLTASLTPEALAAAASSLHYLGGRAEAIMELYRERQQQAAAVHSSAPHTPATSPQGKSAKLLGRAETGDAAASLSAAAAAGDAPDQPPPLSQARTALHAGMQYACKFLATRIVFWDGRVGWCEQLYRHHALSPASRIEPQLEGLNRQLGALCPGLQEPVRNTLARHLLIAAVQAIERALLDGGPCRWFIPADANAIEQDLFKLRSLFHAEGEGLDRELIDGELERVRRLLPLLRLEVGPMMDLLKTARTHGTAALTSHTGAPGAAFDESTLMRVLAHRPERNGSKLLKTLYKLPKRIK